MPQRLYMAHKVGNVYHLAIHTKKLLNKNLARGWKPIPMSCCLRPGAEPGPSFLIGP